jgi:Flp pilus assembly protein TadG
MAALTTKKVREAMRLFRHSSERGAEVVELALVMPVLLLVIMGVVDFGFLFQRYAVLTNAAMEGARVGTLPGYQIPQDVTARVNAYAASGGVPAASIVVQAIAATVPAAGGGNYPAVQVTVTHNYTLDYIGPIAAIFGGQGARTVTMRARSIMRLQAGAAAAP